MTRHGFSGPDFRDPQQRSAAVAGLRMRLAEKRNDAIGRSKLLPLCSFPQLPDKLKEADRG
jgi:hypothetical protein